MALLKNKILPVGVTAAYHKIQSINLNNGVIEITLYLDGANRVAGSSPIVGYQVKADVDVIFSEEALEVEGITPKRAAYAGQGDRS